MNETTELIMKQLNQKKTHAITHELGGGDEIDATKLKNIDAVPVSNSMIADGAVTTSKLSDLSVTTAKIAIGAVGVNQLDATLLNSPVNNVAVQAEFDRRGINVMKFGALGDGVTDDSNAIIAAITSVSSTGGGIVYFPEGTYLVSKRIDVKGNIIYAGAGKTASIIRKKSTHINSEMFRQSPTETNVIFRDLQIDGQKADGNVTTTTGIRIKANNTIVQDCLFKDMLLDSIYIGDTASFSAKNVTIYRNEISNTGRNGITSVSSENLTIERNYIHNVGLLGIDLEADVSATNKEFTIRTNIIETAGDKGIQITNIAESGLVEDNEIRDTVSSGIILAQDVQNVIVQNNRIFDAGLYGIEIRSQNSTTLNYPRHNRLIGNLIQRVQRHGIYILSNVTYIDMLYNRIIDPRRDTGASYSYIRLESGASYCNISYNRGETILSTVTTGLITDGAALYLTIAFNRFNNVTTGISNGASTVTTFGNWVNGSTAEPAFLNDKIRIDVNGQFTRFLNGLQLTYGTGSPEGVVTANQGSIYIRKDGSASQALYIKESGTGNTGWVAK
ncbi:glycosyl hydrolase family 28-related protein [Paenibacillus sp. LjRoot56]|uniref:right-handed parallel beta-helix repeat-containing protein n=1 Tax=Paenibacillus sp. LjRoot56 TaxID=3342333 RepID=UPI003ECF0F0C